MNNNLSYYNKMSCIVNSIYKRNINEINAKLTEPELVCQGVVIHRLRHTHSSLELKLIA